MIFHCHIVAAAPKLGDYETSVTMKAGTTKSVEIPFSAHPAPQVTVAFQDGGAVRDTQRIKMAGVEERKSVLSFGDAERADSGVYTVTLANAHGKATATVTLTVLGKPPHMDAYSRLAHRFSSLYLHPYIIYTIVLAYIRIRCAEMPVEKALHNVCCV
jgi:hypothetical protein